MSDLDWYKRLKKSRWPCTSNLYFRISFFYYLKLINLENYATHRIPAYKLALPYVVTLYSRGLLHSFGSNFPSIFQYRQYNQWTKFFKKLYSPSNSIYVWTFSLLWNFMQLYKIDQIKLNFLSRTITVWNWIVTF